MITKMFEIRDEGTLIPVMAIKLSPSNPEQGKLLARAGYGADERDQSQYTFLTTINGGSGEGASDVYKWPTRTMHNAHKYIKANFDSLSDGDVVDVQFILKETSHKKESEVQ